MNTLQKEIETYNRLLPSLLSQVGKFALIKDDKLVDTFDTYADAMKHGYTAFKLNQFMVKQIAPAERVAIGLGTFFLVLAVSAGMIEVINHMGNIERNLHK